MENYKVGDIVKGCVTGIEKYGIFVNLDNYYTGLIHISEISEKFVSNINDYVTIGETIRVKIIDKNEGEKMEQFIWETPEELDQKLAQRVRKIRKRRSITQEKLASISGVSYGSIKRFETTGQISLLSLTKIAIALDLADELRNIFTQVPYKDIQEVINETR